MVINKKIAIVFTGMLKYEIRLQNQIVSLRKHGAEVTMFSGNEQNNSSIAKKYDVKIICIPIRYNKYKIYSFVQQLLFCFNVYKKLAKVKFDFIICYNLTTLIAGTLAKRKNPNIYLIFDSLELAVESYSGTIKKMTWGMLQKRCLPYCDIIIHAEKNRLNYFKKLHNLPSEKLVLLENYPLKRDAVFQLKKPDKYVNLIYLGAIMPNRAYLELIKSFSKLDDNLRLDIVGFGSENYVKIVEKEIRLNNAENVRIIPPVPHDNIPELFKKYHIGVLFYENVNLNNYYCAPSKIYDYFNNGLPVISYKYPGLIDLTEKNKIGVCIDEMSPEELKHAIKTIIEKNYFANITPELRHTFIWESQEERYLSLFA